MSLDRDVYEIRYRRANFDLTDVHAPEYPNDGSDRMICNRSSVYTSSEKAAHREKLETITAQMHRAKRNYVFFDFFDAGREILAKTGGICGAWA